MFLSLICLSCPALGQESGLCVVTRVEGQPVVSERGRGEQPAAPGLGLGPNAVVRTGQGERVTLDCTGDLGVVVGPASDLSVLGVLDGGSRPFGLRLLDGIAGFLFGGEGAGGVQVNTPSAVAAVRSTEWAMQVAEGASAVFAREGAVFVFGADDAPVRLGVGDGVDVSADGGLGVVVEWGQPRIDRFDELLGADW